ncbi:hypothetical protein BGX29_007206 [Mortierella sp. GBA35]|nr:hypothetical protein BGX29_007206 [Mortierella sp. GBA35]
MTYDPYMSSPFQSPSCHPRPLNPNTKWYIEISSVTAIKLLPATRTHRCFPYSDASRELSIQTNDGRNMILRASKDIELERWFFVLSKIWELQQQQQQLEQPAGVEDVAAAYASNHLAAHQQSAQLFQRYLEKQYHHQDGAESPLHEQHQPPQKSLSFQQLRPPQKKPLESFLPYEIPPPPRVSAFLPQGFEWSLQEQGDEDDIPIGYNFGYPDTGSAPGDHRSSSKALPVVPRHSSETLNPPSADIYHQRLGCPAASSMEPGKAAIIDSWRRSLHLPLLVDDTTSHVGDLSQLQQQQQQQQQMYARAMDQDKADMINPRTDNRNRESILRRSSLGLDVATCKNTESGGHRSATIAPSPIADDSTLNTLSRLTHWTTPNEDCSQAIAKKNDDIVKAMQDSQSQDDVVKHLAIPAANRSSAVAKEEDELPLGLLQSNRHSRWLNTQLSSENDTSNSQREPQTSTLATTHQLLPSEPITTERTPARGSSALNQLNSLAPLNRDMHHENNFRHNSGFLSITTIQHQQSTSIGNPTSPKSERAPPLTVHVPTRQLWRCPSIPPPSTNSATKPKKYIPTDTTPYTALSTSLSHHPPPRPPRPPSVGLNSLAGPDDPPLTNTKSTLQLTLNTNINRNNDFSLKTSPLLPPTANYKKFSHPQSQPPSNIAVLLQHHPHQQVQHHQQQDISIHPHNPVPPSMPTASTMMMVRQSSDKEIKDAAAGPGHHLLFVGDEEDEDEDEPLALTLSRQQSLRQRQHQHQLQMLQPQQKLPPIHSSSHNSINSNINKVVAGTALGVSGSMGQLSSADGRQHQQQCYEQVTPATSSET